MFRIKNVKIAPCREVSFGRGRWRKKTQKRAARSGRIRRKRRRIVCQVLDSDLARLYSVETRRLNEQVKRNIDRFPEDFMFQLSAEETQNLMSQNTTSSWGGYRKLQYAFTENGVAMLSGVLRSKAAIAVNIRIMRAFTAMRSFLQTNALSFSGWKHWNTTILLSSNK